jgi:multimeric flavodoxin WrbA
MLKMKIIAINGSPRKKGNTARLLEEALRGALNTGTDTEMLHLADYSFGGCLGCEGCQDTFTCTIPDDMRKIYPKITEADGLILGSPTYFYNITALTKAFLERCYCLESFDQRDRSRWASILEAEGVRYASVIAVCEQHSAEDMGLTVPAMTKPLGSLGYRIVDEVRAVGFFDAGRVANDPSVLEEARSAGERLAGTVILKSKIAKTLTSKKSDK